MSDAVSILVPAYEAARFIDRTLNFARGQTHTNIRILVSVDVSTDNTVAVARAHERQDARITVFEQKERLGWAGNVNFLLGRVETPYCFLYFHDDVIVPQYTSYLLGVLQSDAEAASVQCDVANCGARDWVVAGREFTGGLAHRLLSFMLTPSRGAPLRGMLRMSKAGGLRLPEGKGGFWVNDPFLLDLAGAGRVMYAPGQLYVRWDFREGGLIHSWKDIDAVTQIEARRANAKSALAILERYAGGDQNLLSKLQLACWLWTATSFVIPLEVQANKPLFQAPADIEPAFGTLPPVSALSAYGDEIAGWAQERAARLEEHMRRTERL